MCICIGAGYSSMPFLFLNWYFTVAWNSLRPVDHKGVDVVELKKSQFLPKKSKHCNNCDNKHYNKPSKPCNTHSNLEVLEGLHDVRPHVLRTVVGVPQLGLETQVKKRTCHREFSQILSRNSQSHLNKQLLPLDDPSGKELLESLPDDVLVVVVVGAVNGPVASLDSGDDGLLGLLWGRLPCPETQSGHLGAIIEGDVEIVHLRFSWLHQSGHTD